jgi:N-acetylglucosamine-6-phosphate deacetylase
VRLPDGTLAGSDLSMDRAIRNVQSYVSGLASEQAVAAATSTPAAVLGLPDRGTLADGAVGDLVVLDAAGHVAATVIGGELAHDVRAAA